MSKLEAYECDSCGKLLKTDSEDLRTVYGNICVGINGGIVGNNLKAGKVITESHYCVDCLVRIVKAESVSRSQESALFNAFD